MDLKEAIILLCIHFADKNERLLSAWDVVHAKLVEEKFTSTNTQSAAIAQIATEMEMAADIHHRDNRHHVTEATLREWARQLRAL